MPAALGNKLAPQIMKDFSEIVLAKRNAPTAPGGQPSFAWSTIDATADLKNRALPASSNMPPSFKPLVEAHRRRLAQSATPAG